MTVTIIKSYDSIGIAINRTEIINDLAPREVRDLNPQNRKMNITIAAAIYTKPENIDDSMKSLKNILVIILGATLSISASIWFFHYSRNRHGHHEKRILISEINDLKRHYQANLEWLKNIDFKKGTPLEFYFQRMKSHDNLLLNTHDTHRTLPHKNTPLLAHIKLRNRNYNLEIEELIKISKNKKIDLEVKEELRSFCISKTLFLIKWLTVVQKQIKNKAIWKLLLYKKTRKLRNITLLKGIKSFRKKYGIPDEHYWVNKHAILKKRSQPSNVILYKLRSDMSSKIKILNRDSQYISLENYIIMPPSSSVGKRGGNILHINTQNNHYGQNASATAFVNEYLLKDGAKAFKNDSSVLKFAAEKALENEGIFLEFGFCTGTTLNFIAALAYDRDIFGFDSLQGLPVNWRSGFPEKVFAYKDENRFPFVPLPNASLVIGLIEDTLPIFTTDVLTDTPIAFIHIDSDTAEAATTIYNNLKDKIEPGKTIIILDEGYNFSDKENARDDEWKKHEFSATEQFAREMGYTIKYLAFNENHQQLVLVFNK